MLGLSIDKNCDETLTHQIFQQLCDCIMTGALGAGQRLPSSRHLAEYLGVSRNIVLEAYDRLRFEGFIDSRPGAGTYVSSGATLAPAPLLIHPPPQPPTSPPHIEIDFRYGIPDLDKFPRSQWAQAWRQAFVNLPSQELSYTHPQGCHLLRNEICRYLLHNRGISCQPEQIVITSGSSQAYFIAARLLGSASCTAAMEDPGNQDIRHFLTGLLGQVSALPVDEHGLDTQTLDKLTPIPRLIFVTPCCQFPTGGLLPIQRRIQLIEYARRNQAYIIEDDYDREFVFQGPPASPLYSLDPNRVLYTGSFSKLTVPGFRLGYLILPSNLCQAFREMIYYGTFQPSILDQLALAEFLAKGSLQRHIAKMNKVYHRRRQLLIAELSRHFPSRYRIVGGNSGLHATVEFPGIAFTDDIYEKLIQQGIRLYRVEDHALHKGRYTSQIIFGYGNVSEKAIQTGIQRLAIVLSSQYPSLSNS